MDPVLTLSEPSTAVDPGGEARLLVSVRNVGELVEQYRFELLGTAVGWAQVVPTEVSVLPNGQESKQVEVIFRPPPAPAAPVGQIPFGVRCVSRERRERCAVVEGDVMVGAVHGLSAELEPVTPAGSRSGRYRARFTNTGTVPVALTLSAQDKRRQLGFAVAPRELTVLPGHSEPVYIAVRPRQPILRGKVISHQWELTYRSVEQNRDAALPGVFEQRPVLGKAVLAVAAVLLVAVLAGTAFFVHSTKNPAPLALDGSPAATALLGATALTDTSAKVLWQPSPYATSYVVQAVTKDGAVTGTKEIADPDQSVFVWDGLKPGANCFRVLVVGTGGRSEPSQAKCALVVPAVNSSSSASATTASVATPTATPTATATAEITPVATQTATATTAPARTLRDFYVIYAVVPIDDQANQGVAEQDVADLQAAGSHARLVDSRDYPALLDGTGGLWVVVADGFPTFQSALDECTARHAIAPACYAVDPSVS